MTYEETLERLRSLDRRNDSEEANDFEVAHVAADFALLAFLTELGYIELVTAFKNVGRWYA